MKRLPHHYATGFTLIELSIVLVIIGLVAGGIIIGKDLIRASQLRSILTDQASIETAIKTFKLNYNCVPGDCLTATQFWPTDASCPTTPTNTTPKIDTCNGNGDSKAGNSNGSGAIIALNYERYRLWQHLANAALIPGMYSGVAGNIGSYHCIPGINIPSSKITGIAYQISYIWLT